MEPKRGRDDSSKELLLGKRALEAGLLNPGQLGEALAERARRASGSGDVPSLASILVEKGFVKKEQIGALSGEAGPAEGVPFGKYLLKKEVARGGMGIVHDAEDTSLGRRVAIKMLVVNPHLPPEEVQQDEQRFLREAKLAANLPKHPHIVGIYEVGVVEGKRYLSMEFVEGREMSEWRKQTRAGIPAQVRVLRDAALAAHHAHENGVIHRDLKPQNVLVDAKGEPHITDFGLAWSMRPGSGTRLTAPDITLGTPVYMSPEQAKGRKPIDRRTDVYSLGIMLYEILAGKPPFQGDTPIEVMTKKVTDEVPRPSSVRRLVIRPGLDRTIEGICMKALAKDPDGRYPTALAFAEDLTRWLEGQKVKVAPPPGRRWILLGAAAAVALAAALGWAAFRPRPPAVVKPVPTPPRDPVPVPPKDPVPVPPKDPAPFRPVKVEGEKMKVISRTGGTVAMQTTYPGWEGSWSNNAHLFWTKASPGDRLKLALPSEDAGRRTLVVAAARSTDYGVFKILFNGKVVEEKLDLWGPKIAHTGELKYEGVDVLPGVNEIEFEIVGTNPKAKPWQAGSPLYQFGLDFVALR
jgi:serine/threonine protein kinase